MKKSYCIISLMILVGLILVLFPKQVVDDSYILFRYAENFKNGNGLIWNIGEYTQSYTGILILALLIISPLSYVLTAQIIGVVSFLIGGHVLYLLSKESPVKWLILVCYLFSPAIYVHVFSGLETCLFMTLSFASVYFWKLHKEYWLLVSVVLISLSRPEGVIFAILFLINQKNKLVSKHKGKK